MVNLPAFQENAESGSISSYLWGLGSGFIALAVWTWYAVANSNFLKRHPHIAPSHWCSIVGIGTFFWVLVIISLSFLFPFSSGYIEKYSTFTPELHNFVWGSLILGVVCSWLAFTLWNKASSLLPMSLAGQMLIFETIFGLLFVYILEQRMPFLLEMGGIACMLLGIFFSLQLVKKRGIRLN